MRHGRRYPWAVAAVAVLLLLAGCPGTDQRSVAGRQARPTPSPFPSVLPTKASPPPAPLDGSSSPEPDPVYPDFGNPMIDVKHYDLALDWKPDARVLTGTATLTIRVVRETAEIALDFSDAYTIDSATIDGAAVTAVRRGGDLVLPAAGTLAPGATVKATVAYRGTPKEGPFPGDRSDVKHSGIRVGRDGAVWAMHEPYGAYTWYPCSDQPSDKALFDVAITAPAGWRGVSSGRLTGVEPTPDGGSTHRWHGTEPSSTYLVAFAVDRYQRHDATGPGGVPLTYWLRRTDEAAMLPLVRQTPQMLAWLQRRFGPFPFSSAGVVVVRDGSALETQTMVTMGPLVGRTGESVLLHELAHQYFGDAVGPRTWRDVWLNEGFATYVEMLYKVDRWGADPARTLRRWWDDDRVFRPKAGPPGAYDRRLFAARNVYYGPALMLHELRTILGEEPFFAMLHDWVQHHRHTSQDGASFVAWLVAYTGRDLSGVVGKWINSPTTPPYPG